MALPLPTFTGCTSIVLFSFNLLTNRDHLKQIVNMISYTKISPDCHTWRRIEFQFDFEDCTGDCGGVSKSLTCLGQKRGSVNSIGLGNKGNKTKRKINSAAKDETRFVTFFSNLNLYT